MKQCLEDKNRQHFVKDTRHNPSLFSQDGSLWRPTSRWHNMGGEWRKGDTPGVVLFVAAPLPETRATSEEEREAQGPWRRDEPLPASCSWGEQGASPHKMTPQAQRKLVNKTAGPTWLPLRKLRAQRPGEWKIRF